MSKFEKDLSQGSVAKQLILFALPFIISNVIQSLYSVADMVIVGQFAGTVSMSGVNIGSQITLLMTNLVIGLSAGGTVLIAQYLGAGMKQELKETIGTLFTTLLVAAVVLTVFMLFFRTQALRLIKTPAESFDEANRYLLITTLGTLFIFGYNALSAVMRGMGDSKRPLYFVAIACVTNIVLDIVLVAGFHMAATGAALATIFSQAVSMILCIIYLKRNDFVFDFGLKSFGFHKERLQKLMQVGIPTTVQNVTVGISFLFLTAMVNSLGVTASAAVGAVGKFNTFAILPALAISSAISAMSAQNIGAGEQKRAVDTMKTGMIMSICITVVIFVLARLFPGPILRMFANDDAMIAAGTVYMSTMTFDYLIAPFIFSLNGLYIGSGHTVFSLINSVLSSLAFRIPAAYIFGIVMELGLKGVGMGAPIASAAALVLGVIYFFSGKWKEATILAKEAED